jgi:hypothetical protein
MCRRPAAAPAGYMSPFMVVVRARRRSDRRFVDGAGYNRWADSNRIVVLYPQVQPRYGLAIGSWQWLNNPFGCWDWWGYTGSDYATQGGVQIKAVRAMLERLAAPRQP